MQTITNKDENLSLETHISKALLNHLYEGIYFVDNKRQIKFWNKGAENITGYMHDEIIGKYCFDDILCHEDEEGNSLCVTGCPLLASIQNDSFVDKRIYLYHKEGHRIPVRVHVSPLKDSKGNIIGAVEVFIDDSDFDNLKHTNNKLEELSEHKNNFLGMVAHDLRNPLNIISNFTSFIIDVNNKNLSDVQKSILQRMYLASENMLMIINDLLDITAIESGKIKLNRKKESIEKVLSININDMKLIADQKNISINIDIEQDLPEIFVDIERFSQVIENLLSNAVKFSFPDTIVTITVKKVDSKLYITIKDQGQGIPEKDFPKLFKPFKKISTKPTGSEKSTGLGLVIVKKIVELHNGIIEVNSKLKKGTEFIIKLPYSG